MLTLGVGVQVDHLEDRKNSKVRFISKRPKRSTRDLAVPKQLQILVVPNLPQTGTEHAAVILASSLEEVGGMRIILFSTTPESNPDGRY